MKHTDLKARLQQATPLLAPGIYDALSALVAEQAGFEALYLSGASIAYTMLGRSDIGLTSYAEVQQTLSHITERVETPVIVDADTGFGNALNVMRTVRGFERAGATVSQYVHHQRSDLDHRGGPVRTQSLPALDQHRPCGETCRIGRAAACRRSARKIACRAV